MWIYCNFIIHSPVFGQLDYVQFLAVTEKTAMNIDVHIFCRLRLSVLLGKYPSRLSVSYGNAVYFYEKVAVFFSKVVILFYISTCSELEFHVLHISVLSHSFYF